MENRKRYIYLKFRIKDDVNLPDAYLVSEDKDRVDHWDGDDQGTPPPDKKPESEPTNKFRILSSEFERSMEEFHTAIPFIMQMTPFLLRIQIEKTLRNFAQQHGEIMAIIHFTTPIY